MGGSVSCGFWSTVCVCVLDEVVSCFVCSRTAAKLLFMLDAVAIPCSASCVCNVNNGLSLVVRAEGLLPVNTLQENLLQNHDKCHKVVFG